MSTTFCSGLSGADFTLLSIDRMCSTSSIKCPSPSKWCPKKRNVSEARKEGITEEFTRSTVHDAKANI
ncbi:hypothetical protein T10_9062 [Trichinella papuae]|uniref:Uncharacterized protein n=1 Tax=Trichinella papuae TaxID=268474 RepID=A0A0V1M8W7_9BILA|nr:hypothetical protein T10_9062 [Trichinella papuae]